MFSLYVHGPIRMHLPTLQWVGALECMHVILEGDGDIVTIKRRYPILAPPGDLRLRRVGTSTEPKVKTEGNGGKFWIRELLDPTSVCGTNVNRYLKASLPP